MKELINRLVALREAWRELEELVPENKRDVGFAKDSILQVGPLLDNLINEQESPEVIIPKIRMIINWFRTRKAQGDPKVFGIAISDEDAACRFYELVIELGVTLAQISPIGGHCPLTLCTVEEVAAERLDVIYLPSGHMFEWSALANYIRTVQGYELTNAGNIWHNLVRIHDGDNLRDIGLLDELSLLRFRNPLSYRENVHFSEKEIELIVQKALSTNPPTSLAFDPTILEQLRREQVEADARIAAELQDQVETRDAAVPDDLSPEQQRIHERRIQHAQLLDVLSELDGFTPDQKDEIISLLASNCLPEVVITELITNSLGNRNDYISKLLSLNRLLFRLNHIVGFKEQLPLFLACEQDQLTRLWDLRYVRDRLWHLSNYSSASEFWQGVMRNGDGFFDILACFPEGEPQTLFLRSIYPELTLEVSRLISTLGTVPISDEDKTSIAMLGVKQYLPDIVIQEVVTNSHNKRDDYIRKLTTLKAYFFPIVKNYLPLILDAQEPICDHLHKLLNDYDSDEGLTEQYLQCCLDVLPAEFWCTMSRHDYVFTFILRRLQGYPQQTQAFLQKLGPEVLFECMENERFSYPDTLDLVLPHCPEASLRRQILTRFFGNLPETVTEELVTNGHNKRDVYSQRLRKMYQCDDLLGSDDLTDWLPYFLNYKEDISNDLLQLIVTGEAPYNLLPDFGFFETDKPLKEELIKFIQKEEFPPEFWCSRIRQNKDWVRDILGFLKYDKRKKEFVRSFFTQEGESSSIKHQEVLFELFGDNTHHMEQILKDALDYPDGDERAEKTWTEIFNSFAAGFKDSDEPTLTLNNY